MSGSKNQSCSESQFHPESQPPPEPQPHPSLAQTAVALAELEHHPLAGRPEVIEQAAAELLVLWPDAYADDVLIWAASH